MRIKINKQDFKLVIDEIDKAKKGAKQAVTQFYSQAARIMIYDIRETILRGNSPVKGQRRFVDYTERYKTRILKGYYPNKKLRPINLKLSGRMLNSLASREKADGWTVYFTNKLARIHSLEGPRGRRDKIRKVAPFGTEKWKTSVLKNSKEFIKEKALKELVKRLRSI